MAEFDAYIVVNVQLYEPNDFEKPIDRENHFAYVEQAPITTTKNWHVVENELRFLGIQLRPAFVAEPECTGVVERFVKTLKEELLWTERFEIVQDFQAVLYAFLERCNAGWPGTRRPREPSP